MLEEASDYLKILTDNLRMLAATELQVSAWPGHERCGVHALVLKDVWTT